MTTEKAKEILYLEWQGFLENNIDYAGVSNAYKLAFKALEQMSVIDDIKAEIEEVTKCPYGTCVGAGKCANTNDCMLMGKHALEIIDKHISGKDGE